MTKYSPQAYPICREPASGMIPVHVTGHYVYTIFSLDAELLYVGETRDLSRRLAQHKRLSPWWSDAAQVEFEIFPDRKTAS